MLYCVVDTSDWDTALASIPSTVYEGHILSGKNGCLTVYEGHTRMRLCVYSDCFIVQSLCCISTRTSAIQGPTLQINHSECVCYKLYTYSIVSVYLMDAWSHKLISWSLNFSFDNCPNRCCVLHGVVNILVSYPYFGAPLPPRLRVPYHSGLILQGNLSFSQQPQIWQSAKSTPPWWSWNTTGRASRKSCRPCGKNR